MRTGLCIFSIAILVGLLAGMAIPVVRAQDISTVDIFFHVADSGGFEPLNLETIPEDATGTIVIEGTSTIAPSTRVGVWIQNICGEAPPAGIPTPTASPTPTGTVTPPADCPADIYYKIEVTTTWENYWYTDPSGSLGYSDKNLAPWMEYTYGGSENLTTDTGERCGPANVRTGACGYVEIQGTIVASDIDPEGAWQEKFELQPRQPDWCCTLATIHYTITLSTSPINQNCVGQYAIGQLLTTFPLNSTNSDGINLRWLISTSYPAPGDWYVVTVGGSWKDDNTGPDLRSVSMKVGGGTWTPLDSNNSNEGCTNTNSTSDSHYLQMASSSTNWLRVTDEDGGFAANNGTLQISIYAVAAYSPYPTGCELQYQVGDLIEQRMVPAQFQNGWALAHSDKGGPGGDTVGPLLTRYYMLETIGGPANIGFLPFGAGGLTWDADLGNLTSDPLSVPSTWEEITVAGQVTCVVHTDPVGHVKVFFPSDARVLEQIQKFYYAFRVRDTGLYADNTGSLGYRLYEATLQQVTSPDVPPTPTGCSLFSHDTTPIASLVIPATNETGVSLPTLTSGTLYALEVAGDGWMEGGTVETFTVQISDDNGSTWDDLEHYPNLLCAAAPDGDHVIIYVYGASGKIWKARVNDGDSNFATNTGNIGLDVFLGVNSPDYWPNCQDYSLTLIPLSEEQRKIPGNSSEGKAIPASSILGLSRPYSIEITDTSKWYEAGAGTGSYLVDISDDGGSTWVAMDDYPGLCVEQIGDDGRFQIYFSATSNNYKLRVRDGDDDFLSNTGMLLYNLYGATSANPLPPGPGDTPPAPPEWVVACNEAYARPDTFITWEQIAEFPGGAINLPLPRVGEWLDYLRASITFYFAWCPQHTAALKTIGAVALDKEPMASIKDMVDFFRSIQTLLESYQAAGGGTENSLTSQEPSLFSDSGSIGTSGGSSSYNVPSAAGPWDLFMVGTFDPVTNIWFGGQLDMAASLGSTDLSVMDTYQALCSDKFYPLFGFAAEPFCSLMSMMRNSKIVTWLLLGLDLFLAVWWVFKYVPGYLKKLWSLLSGNKGTIIKGL